MTFAQHLFRLGARRCLGALIAILFTFIAVGPIAPHSVMAAESQPATVRSDRRLDRERTVRTSQDDRATSQNATPASRRPRAIRR